ncbi:MAG: SHD1 domain-containing protein [Planctomycetota bacterium]|nr:SHD1 domain-containing protein [Planctomycetota bacterium]
MRLILLIVILVAASSQALGDDPDSKEHEARLATIADALASGKEVELDEPHIELGAVGRLNPRLGVTVIQVLDDESMLATSYKRPFLLRGVPTKGIVDGGDFGPIRDEMKKALLVVTGTETYDTAIGGTKTVFVVEPVQGELLKMVAAFVDERDRKLCTREWADSTGKFKVEAEYLEFKNSKVSLRKTDTGKTVEIALAQLDKTSRDWVAKWSKGRREREALQTKLRSLGLDSNGKEKKTAK